MRRAGLILVGLLLVGALLYGFLAQEPSPPASEPELAGRVRRAQPDWGNYTEDLKAYLGATPVAQWSGEPVQARVDGNVVAVTFRLEPPWATYAFGMPLLLRDPLGSVHQNQDYRREDSAGVYTFVLSEFDPDAPLPWVEIKFPSERQKRLVFDASGVWTSAGAR